MYPRPTPRHAGCIPDPWAATQDVSRVLLDFPDIVDQIMYFASQRDRRDDKGGGGQGLFGDSKLE